MKISQLLQVSEDFRTMSQNASAIQSGQPTAAQSTQNRQAATALRAQQQAQRNAAGVTGRPAALANPTTSAANPAVASGAATPAPTSNTSAPTGAQGPTGDPTLDQPLPPGAPPRSFAQKVGGIAKAVGAVPGGIAGIGRALKKGYAAGANAVGGPGAAPSASGSNQPTGAAAGGGDELAQLQSTLQAMDQRMRRAGF
jgi:hypothetical protein